MGTNYRKPVKSPTMDDTSTTKDEAPTFVRSHFVGQGENTLLLAENIKEVEEKYKEQLDNGNMPLNHSKVIVLGDKRVGKTSLTRRLTGEKIRDDEQSTVGIETRYVESKSVNMAWKPCDYSIEDDLTDNVAYLTAQSFSPSPASTHTEVARSVFDLFVMALLPALTIAILGGFHFGFAIIWLVTYGCARLYNKNNLFATVIDSLALGLTAVDFLIQKDLFRLFHFFDDLGKGYHLGVISSLLTNLMFAFVGGLVGFSLSLPSRNGIVLAAFLMTAPLSPKAEILGLSSLDILLPRILKYAGFVSGMAVGTHLIYSKSIYSYLKTLRNEQRNGVKWIMFVTVLLGHIAFYVTFTTQLSHVVCEILLCFWAGILFGLSYADMSRRSFSLKNFMYQRPRAIRYTIGATLTFLYFHRIVGWTFLGGVSSTEQVKLAIGIIALSFRGYIEYNKKSKIRIGTQRGGLPLAEIAEHRTKMYKGEPRLEKRLTLLDCAGEKDFHTWYPIFMPKRAIYIVVFNLYNAVYDHERHSEHQLKKIRYWLNSILAHSDHPDSTVFLVGTHSKSIKKPDEAKIRQFEDDLKEKILNNPRYNSLLFSSKDRLLFKIDCKFSSECELESLRGCIWNFAEKADYMREPIPIAWKRALSIILSSAPVGEINIAKSEAMKAVQAKIPNLSDTSFESLLEVFNNSGYILCEPNDDYIVVDPQIIAEILTEITSFSKDSLPPKFAMAFLRFTMASDEHDGILEEPLLDYALEKCLASRSATITDQSKNVLKRLLRAYNFICPVTSANSNGGSPGNGFIVPSKLPPSPPKAWIRDSCDTFFFDFHEFHAEPVFHRLMAFCISNLSDTNSPGMFKYIYRDMGFFRTTEGCVYCIKLDEWVPNQNVIKLSVDKDERNSSFEILGHLFRALCQICEKGFRKVRNMNCGFACERWGPGINHDGCSNAEMIHIVTLYKQGEDVETPPNGTFTYTCGGHALRKTWQTSVEQRQLQDVQANGLGSFDGLENQSGPSSQFNDVVLAKLTKHIGSFWEFLGVYLNVPDTRLKKIKDQHPHDVDKCIFEMLQFWRKHARSNEQTGDLKGIMTAALRQCEQNDVVEELDKILLENSRN